MIPKCVSMIDEEEVYGSEDPCMEYIQDLPTLDSIPFEIDSLEECEDEDDYVPEFNYVITYDQPGLGSGISYNETVYQEEEEEEEEEEEQKHEQEDPDYRYNDISSQEQSEFFDYDDCVDPFELLTEIIKKGNHLILKDFLKNTLKDKDLFLMYMKQSKPEQCNSVIHCLVKNEMESMIKVIFEIYNYANHMSLEECIDILDLCDKTHQTQIHDYISSKFYNDNKISNQTITVV